MYMCERFWKKIQLKAICVFVSISALSNANYLPDDIFHSLKYSPLKS